MNRRKSILQRQEYLILATAIVALFVIFVIVVAAKDTTDTIDAASEPHTAAKPTTTEPTTAIPEETASAAWQRAIAGICWTADGWARSRRQIRRSIWVWSAR